MKQAFRWFAIGAGVLVVTGTMVGQAARALTLETIYDPTSRVNFSGVPIPDVTWIDDNTYIQPQRSGGRATEWVRRDVATGQTKPLFDADRMEAAIASAPNGGRAEARLLARSADL